MDFYEVLIKLDEAAVLPTAALKNPSVSGAIDKKNAELKKKGKQIKADSKTGRIEVTRIDRVASNAIDIINKIN